jgi:hypothetical protein
LQRLEFCDEDNQDCNRRDAPDCPETLLLQWGGILRRGAGRCDHRNAPACRTTTCFCNGEEYCSEAASGCDRRNAPVCGDNGDFCDGDEYCDEDLDQCSSSGDPCPDDGATATGPKAATSSMTIGILGNPCSAETICDETGDSCESIAMVA